MACSAVVGASPGTRAWVQRVVDAAATTGDTTLNGILRRGEGDEPKLKLFIALVAREGAHESTVENW